MKKSTTISVVLLFFQAPFGTAEALADTSLITQANEVLDFYRRLKPKPARLLLPTKDYKHYRLALANKQCQEAEDILMPVFLRQYPDKSPVVGKEAKKSAWYAAVGAKVYPDLLFCLAMKNLHEGLAEITRKKIKADLFPHSLYGTGRSDNVYKIAVKKRDIGLSYLRNLVGVGFDPAQFELAKLGYQGGIVSLRRGYEYFVFARVKHLGWKIPKLEQMLQDAAKALTQEEANRLQEKAKTGPWDSLAIQYKK